MNFPDAVRALNDGICEEIELNGCFYKVDALNRLVGAISENAIKTPISHISSYLSDKWRLAKVKQQGEVVEVNKFCCTVCGSTFESHKKCCGAETVRLKGRFVKTIPSKMKILTEVGFVSLGTCFIKKTVDVQKIDKLFALVEVPTS